MLNIKDTEVPLSAYKLNKLKNIYSYNYYTIEYFHYFIIINYSSQKLYSFLSIPICTVHADFCGWL